ncbi:MAG: bifunctional hydroxymethylpyrimidine kinase/phosphomethylpyrimidine kinase [Synergistaceae bacterium]|jgi:hydroxymethylpyrimidine/phosphomethylpyrimidine kinase|nr:bifunctional hydroxymethylpyrimidine kinase/phosphomethylpyrimidine kinase [Synergistaceae bacterium]
MIYRAIALTVAGSDSGGGAGIQADLKTFAALGVFGTSAVTALTAQNSLGVTHVEVTSCESLRRQMEAVLSDFPVAAAKTGMVARAELIEVIADVFSAFPVPALVVDPVMVATSGAVLLDDGAEEALRKRLLPLAEVVTPNLPEASRLVGFPVDDVPSMEAAARRLVELGASSALVKGGHGSGPVVTDLFFDGSEVRLFRHSRLETADSHGTGCTLSAAIAAERAAGLPPAAAVERGLAYLQLALRHGFRPGRGPGPVGHAVVPPWLAGRK